MSQDPSLLTTLLKSGTYSPIFSLLSFMKYFFFLSFLFCSSLYGQVNRTPKPKLNVVKSFGSITKDDSTVCNNILASVNHIKNCVVNLDSKLLLTVRTRTCDQIYLISKGEVERYYEVYPDGRYIDYGTERDAQ